MLSEVIFMNINNLDQIHEQDSVVEKQLNNLYNMSSRQLGDYYLVIHDFSINFDFLFDIFGLNMTLKVHIILHHFKEYFDLAGKARMHINGEFVDSAHYSIIKTEDRVHGFKVKRVIGTPVHVDRQISKVNCFIPPSQFSL